MKEEISEDLRLFIESLNENIPQLSVDCVIFGFHDNELRVLLSKFRGTDLWSLQGGYVKQTEDIQEAALRIIHERIGLKDIFLEQFHIFGNANRSTINTFKQIYHDEPIDIESIPFLAQRFVSVGYYSLVEFSKVVPQVDIFFEQCKWFNIKYLPNLAFDHKAIIQKALETMRLNIDYQLVGFNLMPETFTMNDLQTLYETILDEELRRNNFQRKMLELNILERLEKQYSGGAHKAPYLYRFKR